MHATPSLSHRLCTLNTSVGLDKGAHVNKAYFPVQLLLPSPLEIVSMPPAHVLWQQIGWSWLPSRQLLQAPSHPLGCLVEHLGCPGLAGCQVGKHWPAGPPFASGPPRREEPLRETEDRDAVAQLQTTELRARDTCITLCKFQMDVLI